MGWYYQRCAVGGVVLPTVWVGGVVLPMVWVGRGSATDGRRELGSHTNGQNV